MEENWWFHGATGDNCAMRGMLNSREPKKDFKARAPRWLVGLVWARRGGLPPFGGSGGGTLSVHSHLCLFSCCLRVRSPAPHPAHHLSLTIPPPSVRFLSRPSLNCRRASASFASGCSLAQRRSSSSSATAPSSRSSWAATGGSPTAKYSPSASDLRAGGHRGRWQRLLGCFAAQGAPASETPPPEINWRGSQSQCSGLRGQAKPAQLGARRVIRPLRGAGEAPRERGSFPLGWDTQWNKMK